MNDVQQLVQKNAAMEHVIILWVTIAYLKNLADHHLRLI